MSPTAIDRSRLTRHHLRLRHPAATPSASAVSNTILAKESSASRCCSTTTSKWCRGEIVIMTGPSGSGKTTLLTLIGTLRTVQEGSVNVLGQRTARRDGRTADRRSPRAGLYLSTPQPLCVAHRLGKRQDGPGTVRAEGRANRPPRDRHAHPAGAGTADPLQAGESFRRAKAARRHRPRRWPTARELVLADEPTAALDGKSGREVVTLFQEFARTQRMHDPDGHARQPHPRRCRPDRQHGRRPDRLQRVGSGVGVDLRVPANCPCFAQLTPRTLSYVADHMKLEAYSPGAVVTRQGDPGDKFYLIRSGSVDVIKDEGAGRRTVTRLQRGDFFGETALLTGRGATRRSWRPRKSRSMRWARAISTPSSWPARRWRKSCARRCLPVNERRECSPHTPCADKRGTRRSQIKSCPHTECADYIPSAHGSR